MSDLTRLLQENLAKNEEILLLTKQIKTYIRRQIIWSIFRLFLILAPIILGIIYLPPYLKIFLKKIASFLSILPS
jgi:hypothetical protein